MVMAQPKKKVKMHKFLVAIKDSQPVYLDINVAPSKLSLSSFLLFCEADLRLRNEMENNNVKN